MHNTISRGMVTTEHVFEMEQPRYIQSNPVHTLSSHRILYSNVCMVVCLVRFSYLIPGIHRSPRCQEEGDHLCSTIESCSMEGSLANLTQPQRRDTQTLRRAEKDHIRSYKVRSTQKYADICIIQSHRVGWRTLRRAQPYLPIHIHIHTYRRHSITTQPNKQTNTGS